MGLLGFVKFGALVKEGTQACFGTESIYIEDVGHNDHNIPQIKEQAPNVVVHVHKKRLVSPILLLRNSTQHASVSLLGDIIASNTSSVQFTSDTGLPPLRPEPNLIDYMVVRHAAPSDLRWAWQSEDGVCNNITHLTRRTAKKKGKRKWS